MEQDKSRYRCRKCGKAVKQDEIYCKDCLIDMKLDEEIADFEKEIEL